MKKLLPILLMLGGFSAPAMADITHTISASTQLRVDAAATDATRIGSTYSVQGTNITAGTMGGIGQATNPAAATHSDGVYTVTTAGDAFSLTESFTGGDATNTIGSGVDVTAHTYTAAVTGDNAAPEINAYGTVTDMPAFGQYYNFFWWLCRFTCWNYCHRRCNFSNSWRSGHYSYGSGSDYVDYPIVCAIMTR